MSDDTTETVEVPKSVLHLAHGVLQAEVAKQANPNYDPQADRDQYKRAEEQIATALNE